MTYKWEKNIKTSIRMKIFFRDNFIKYIYNPFQVLRRKYQFTEKDLFKHVLIQTNYKCTRKCPFCHFGHKNPPKNIEMNKDLFYDIINQLADLNYKGRLGLFEMNEPLTDPRFTEFLVFARKKLPSAWIFISSNGDLLNHRKAIELFNIGLNFIFLSSYDNKAYNKNLKMLEMLSAINRKKINHINRTYQTKWTSRGGNIEQFKTETVYKPCDLVYRVLYIKPSGKVLSCYNDFFDQNEMGDLNYLSVKDVWFGTQFKQLRQELIKGNRNYSKLCNQCDYIGFSNLPNIPLTWKIKNIIR